MTDPLQFARVTRTYRDGQTDRLVLDAIDLTVARGEFVAVTGRSGTGKTTLLNLAGGLDAPDSGSVLVDGVDLAALSHRRLAEIRRRRIGYVFQFGNLIPTLRIAENVALPLELDGVRTRNARMEARSALEAVGLAETAERFPDELSGGERQRVAVARAVVGERVLVLADEPTGALDDVTAEGVLRLLRSRAESGAAVILVTHDGAQAAWADRVLRLRDGSLTTTSTLTGAA